MSTIWSRLVNLTANVTGILPVANGGTGVATNFTALGTSAVTYASVANFVASYTFTPVATNLSNLASATIAANSMTSIQVGRVVLCSGAFNVQATSAAPADTTLTLTLPVTPTSNLGANDAGGVISVVTSGGGQFNSGIVTATTSAKTVTFDYTALTNTSGRVLTYTFSYLAN